MKVPVLTRPHRFKHHEVPQVYGAYAVNTIRFNSDNLYIPPVDPPNDVRHVEIGAGLADVVSGSTVSGFTTDVSEIATDTGHSPWQPGYGRVYNKYYWFVNGDSVALPESKYVLIFGDSGFVIKTIKSQLYAGYMTNSSYPTRQIITHFTATQKIYEITHGYDAAYAWNNPPPRGKLLFEYPSFDEDLYMGPYPFEGDYPLGVIQYGGLFGYVGAGSLLVGTVDSLGGIEVATEIIFDMNSPYGYNYTGPGRCLINFCPLVVNSVLPWIDPTPKPAPPYQGCDIGDWNKGYFPTSRYMLISADGKKPFFNYLNVPVGA